MSNVYDIRTGTAIDGSVIAVYKTPFLNLSKFLKRASSGYSKVAYSEYTDGSNFFAGQNIGSKTGWC